MSYDPTKPAIDERFEVLPDVKLEPIVKNERD